MCKPSITSSQRLSGLISVRPKGLSLLSRMALRRMAWEQLSPARLLTPPCIHNCRMCSSNQAGTRPKHPMIDFNSPFCCALPEMEQLTVHAGTSGQQPGTEQDQIPDPPSAAAAVGLMGFGGNSCARLGMHAAFVNGTISLQFMC